MNRPSPCLLAVAPNGARRLHEDHPAIPLTPEALARDARECLSAGAAMMHLHVRDAQGRHLLDAGAYREAISAIREAVGETMVLQVTSESAGRYGPKVQRRIIAELQPESVSLAVRELFGNESEVQASGELCHTLIEGGSTLQYIVYSPEELQTFQTLRERGVIPALPAFLLFVLGRYETTSVAEPERLQGFLEGLDERDRWAVCAFGATEADCMALAARHGGHARVGFENNLWRSDGETVTCNAELVRLAGERIVAEGRPLMGSTEARNFLGLAAAAGGNL